MPDAAAQLLQIALQMPNGFIKFTPKIVPARLSSIGEHAVTHRGLLV